MCLTPSLSVISISLPFISETMPLTLANNNCPESSATLRSIPVPTRGA